MRTVQKSILMMILLAALLLGLAVPVRAEGEGSGSSANLQNEGNQAEGSPSYEAAATLMNGAKGADFVNPESMGIIAVLGVAKKAVAGPAPQGFGELEGVEFYYDGTSYTYEKLLFMFNEEQDMFGYGPAALEEEGKARTIKVEITEELRGELQAYLDEGRELFKEDYCTIIQEVIDSWISAELSFAPLHSLQISMEGNGRIACAQGEEALSYELPETSYYTSYAGTYKVGAQAGEESRFVKWMMNDEYFSMEPEILVELNEENIKLVAVFEMLPFYEASLSLRNGAKEEHYDAREMQGIMTVLGFAGEVVPGEREGLPETVQMYCDEEGRDLFYFDEESRRFSFGQGALGEKDEAKTIEVEITEALRGSLQAYLRQGDELEFEEDYRSLIQEVVDSWARVKLVFEPRHFLKVDVGGEGTGRFAYAWDEESLSYEETPLPQFFVTSFIGSYKLGAKADEGYTFVKWIKDGKDFATEPEILVDLYEEDVELVAVFEALPQESEATETEATETEAPETEVSETEVVKTEAPETAAVETEAVETVAPETVAPETETQPPAPAMGDDSHLPLWAGLLLISTLLSAALAIKARRRA